MKKAISIVLVMTMIFSFVACGKKNSNIEVVKDYESQPLGESNNVERNIISNIKNPAEFKNGYSWVRCSDGEYLINSKGKVIYTVASGYGMDMCNDACFVKEKISEDEYVYKIINKKGEVVASSADGEFDEILAAGDNLFFVHKYEGGIDTSRNLYGTINEKGEFVNKLRECSFIDSKESRAEYIGAKSFIFGEGVYLNNYCIYMSSCDKYFTTDNTEYTAEGIGNDIYIRDNRGIKAEGSEKRYSDFDDEGYGYIVIRSDGKIEKTSKFDFVINGLLKTEDEEKKTTSFTDPTTGKTAVFSKYYPITDVKPADDNLLIIIKGKDDNTYITVLDKNGNILFEPILGTNAEAGDGKITLYTGDGYSVLDYSGNVLISAGTYNSIDAFSDGVAWAKNLNNQYVIIDEKGKVIAS